MNDDLACALACAASYVLDAPGTRVRYRDMSVLITQNAAGFRVAVEGTNPRNLFNLIRDAVVLDIPMHDHPELGLIPAGAADAAFGFFPLIRNIVDDAPWDATGHSLGGQVVVLIAGLMRLIGKPPRILLPFDPPKSGGDKLAAALADVPGRVTVFNGSIVSHWPFFEGRQFREPPIPIGDYTRDLLEAHSMTRAVAWLEVREKVAV